MVQRECEAFCIAYWKGEFGPLTWHGIAICDNYIVGILLCQLAASDFSHGSSVHGHPLMSQLPMANLFLTGDWLPLIGQAIYPGINGFLGSRASVMLDVVFLAMFFVLPMLGVGIGMARFRRQYTWHKRIQLTVAAILLLAVGAFEIDMQFVSGCANGRSRRHIGRPA